ncbi:peptidase inhibitor family I36 protein [Actinomycetes bacterium KLBMP 9797]
MRIETRQRVRRLVAVLSLAFAIGAVAPGVAHAAPAGGDCPFLDTLCLFEGENFTGERFTVTSLEPGGTCVSLVDHGWGDRARSAINTNSASAAMFFNDDCLGGPFQVAGNSALPSFGGFTPESVWVP